MNPRIAAALCSLSLPAGLLALTPAAPEPRHRPSGAAIEQAVARAHAVAEQAGGRPGKLILAARGDAS